MRELLERIYGRVEESHSLGLPTSVEAWRDSPYGTTLEAIYSALVEHRGFGDFVRRPKLPPVDYFVPKPGFIVEFDERQHFTEPRRIALSLYPADVAMGFDRERWMQRCSEVDAHDNDPAYRDEQRAWYETLRDFAPAVLKLRPTVRLMASAREWCRLDAGNANDVLQFRELIGISPGPWPVRTRADSGARIARVIIARDWIGSPDDARLLLQSLADEWLDGLRTEFLVTCGGFVQFPIEEALGSVEEDPSANPREAMEAILVRAREMARAVLDEATREKLARHVRFVTLGIDTAKTVISTTHNPIRDPHAETVVVVDLVTGRCHATAKSYPTPAQQRGLVRCEDYESHFIQVGDSASVMVLGCHDLSVWNPRSRRAKGWRKRVNEELRRAAIRHRPRVVLHHPHTADSIRTWLNSWNALERALPSVESYAGAGRYWRAEGPRSPLDKVLGKTKKGPTLDFIVG